MTISHRHIAFNTMAKAIQELVGDRSPELEQSLGLLEDAAIALLPHLTEDPTESTLSVAWRCGSLRLIEALPSAPPNSIDVYDDCWQSFSETVSVPYLLALERAGLNISAAAKGLARRAIVGAEIDVQNFLLERIAAMAPLRRVVVSSILTEATDAAFAARYCRAMVEAHPRNASVLLSNCILSRRGHPTIVLILAGAEIENDVAHRLPNFAEDRINSLMSSHGRLGLSKTFGNLEDYCDNPSAQELAATFFDRDYSPPR
jgi:hypothetical protein